MMPAYPWPPYDPSDKQGFCFATVIVQRFPIIVENIAVAVSLHTQELELTQNRAAVVEGKHIEAVARQLKKDILAGAPLKTIYRAAGEALTGEALTDANLTDEYNNEVLRLKELQADSWFTAPSLFTECYLYYFVRSWFSETRHWQQFDPFFTQKQATFRSSGPSVYRLAQRVADPNQIHKFDAPKLQELFEQMVHICLWGNATDLSMIQFLHEADINVLQSVDTLSAESNSHRLLHNDLVAAWEWLKGLRDSRLDVILDNAGFELFTDLMLADFLVTYTPFVRKVVFHPKNIPWFVSDVTAPDFSSLLSCLIAPNFFDHTPTASEAGALRSLHERWKHYLDNGTFSLSIPADSGLGWQMQGSEKSAYWHKPGGYWGLETDDRALFEELKESGLVIFKGDLNFRKLSCDLRWPPTSSFKDILGPLKRSFPILCLRTCKSQVIAGLDDGVVEHLDSQDPLEVEKGWRVSGRFGLIFVSH